MNNKQEEKVEVLK